VACGTGLTEGRRVAVGAHVGLAVPGGVAVDVGWAVLTGRGMAPGPGERWLGDGDGVTVPPWGAGEAGSRAGRDGPGAMGRGPGAGTGRAR
jgi:hypothetical protein